MWHIIDNSKGQYILRISISISNMENNCTQIVMAWGTVPESFKVDSKGAWIAVKYEV